MASPSSQLPKGRDMKTPPTRGPSSPFESGFLRKGAGGGQPPCCCLSPTCDPQNVLPGLPISPLLPFLGWPHITALAKLPPGGTCVPQESSRPFLACPLPLLVSSLLRLVSSPASSVCLAHCCLKAVPKQWHVRNTHRPLSPIPWNLLSGLQSLSAAR